MESKKIKNSKVATVFLLVAGLVGLYVGGGLLFFPSQLQADNGITLSGASHFSEVRAPGAAILSASIVIFIAIFRANWRKSALGLTALFFLSYGFGRLLSLILDGKPADGLFYAMFGELVVGAIAVLLLMKIKQE